MSLFDQSSRWHGYMSSALTIENESARQRVITLNERIRDHVEADGDVRLYLPQENSMPTAVHGDGMSPEEIYILDRWRVAEADFILMNLDNPSFGVGQEAEIACSLGTPIIAFHHQGKLVSRMIKGMPLVFDPEMTGNPSGLLIKYQDQFEFKDLLPEITARLVQIKSSRTPLQEVTLGEASFSSILRSAMSNRDLRVEDLASQTGFSVEFIRQLTSDLDRVSERLPSQVQSNWCLRNIPPDRFNVPGISVIKKLAQCLGVSASDLLGERFMHRAAIEVLAAAGKSGVRLDEFASVSDALGFEIRYSRAARSTDEKSEIVKEIQEAVKRLRGPHNEPG
ncbi:MAG: hypothetical protein KF858_11750 [Candidatus Sumerlaeia bacterium]|nr:hypothetical protein [Candidatus Sumerlaeia bacterium]